MHLGRGGTARSRSCPIRRDSRGSKLDHKVFQLRALGIIVTYVIIVGVGAFLEKPALKGLDATQLNGLMAIAMTAVAGVALAVRGPRLPMTRRTLGGFGVGAMIGIASVFYFLGLARASPCPSRPRPRTPTSLSPWCCPPSSYDSR